MTRNKWRYLVICIVVLLTGCWDSINIEDRAFVVGTGIDLADDDMNGKDGQPIFSVTNQMVIPAGVGLVAEGSENENPFVNITSTGRSIYRSDEHLAEKSSRVPYYEHMLVIVISEKVARKKHLLVHLLDTYTRNVKMRRSIKVVISKDSPEKLLEFTTPERKLPARYLDELLEKGSKYAGILEPEVLGLIQEQHLRKKSFVLPMIEIDEEAHYSKGAVFNGAKNQMIGTFDMEEVQAIAMMTDGVTGNTIEFPYKDETYAFEIDKNRHNIKVDPVNKDRIKVDMTIDLKGILKEAFIKENPMKPEVNEAIQKAVSQEAQNLIEETVHKAKNELNSDVFDIWREIENKHYAIWEEIKDDWEEGENYFSKVDFNVHVDTKIDSSGIIDKSD